MCIGGGTSIDRCFRDIERSYWADENISFPKYNELEKILLKIKDFMVFLAIAVPYLLSVLIIASIIGICRMLTCVMTFKKNS